MTLKGREALAAIIEANAPRVQDWLDRIEKEEGAGAALRAYTNLLEFAIPKQARNELASDGHVEMRISWGTPEDEAAQGEGFSMDSGEAPQ